MDREAAFAALFGVLDVDKHGSLSRQQLESSLPEAFLTILDEHLSEVTLEAFVEGMVAHTQELSDQELKSDCLAALTDRFQWSLVPAAQEEVFEQGWDTLSRLEEGTDGWKEKANKKGFMLHYRKEPGIEIPMVRAKCTFTGIPVQVVARVLTLESRAQWDQNAEVIKFGEFSDGTYATRTVYKGAFNIDDRDFIDVVRTREIDGCVETMYIDGSGWVAEPKPLQIPGEKKKKPKKVIRGKTYLSCNKLAPHNGGTSIVTMSHVDLRLNSTARKIAETQIVGRTRDWFKALRGACTDLMQSDGLTMNAEATNLTSSGVKSEGRARSPTDPGTCETRVIVPSSAVAPGESGQNPRGGEQSQSLLRPSNDPLRDDDCQMCKACLLYTSDAADEEDSVDLGGRRSIKKKKREV
eukprot:TRINITY_DN1240_c0_g1_i6.p1 TRINITY_DN1240_c0_g1~~TRINITY_DN1240_c0_g1_i6.p1  ORF type:complete len:410 (-),score=68.80 TRINITY_DN1240_c0_g1_i6:68-1297(-)